MSEPRTIASVNLAATPERRRCSRGHEWKHEPFGGGSLDSITFDFDGMSSRFCIRCLFEFMRTNPDIGVIEERQNP